MNSAFAVISRVSSVVEPVVVLHNAYQFWPPTSAHQSFVPVGYHNSIQTAVPADFKFKYPRATIKRDLKNNDSVKLARLVTALPDKLESEWAGLRAAPE